MRKLPILLFLLLFSISFCWQTSVSETIRGINLIDDNKALIHGDRMVYVIDTGNGMFNSYDMVLPISSAPAYNPDMNIIVSPSNFSLMAYNTLKKTGTETKIKDVVSGICPGTQGVFYAMAQSDKDYKVNVMKLELNNSLSLVSTLNYSSSLKECRNVNNYPFVLILTSNEIIIFKDANGKESSIVPMKAISSNIIYTEGKFYAASTGGLIASFDQNGRIFNTSSVSDNIMAMIPGNDGIIAYGSSGKLYLFSKDLSLSSVSSMQKGVPLGIHKTGSGYAVLMSSRLALLDAELNPIGDFAFDRIQDNSVFARNQLITASGSVVESNSFPSGCTILSPSDYVNVGYLPFKVSGKAFSYVSDFYVDVKINDEAWTRAAGTGNWSVEIRPMQFPFGKMTVRCKTSEQTDARLSSLVYLDRVSTLPKNTFVVKASSSMESGKSYNISVSDLFNSSVSSFNVSINGEASKMISANKFSFSPSAPGDYTIKFSKEGFDDYAYIARVGGIPFLLLIIGIILVALIAAYVYFSFKK